MNPTQEETTVEVKIGVQHAPREIVVDTDESAEELQRRLHEALADEHGILHVSDNRKRQVLVPAERVAYLELGPSSGRVGFRD